MSAETKKAAQEAQKFFKTVEETSKKFQKSIPDAKLGEKLRKVEQSSQEIVKHIEQSLDAPKQG